MTDRSFPKRRKNRNYSLLALIVGCVCLLIVIGGILLSPVAIYSRANSAMNRGEYSHALTLFERIPGYRDTAQKTQTIRDLLSGQPASLSLTQTEITLIPGQQASLTPVLQPDSAASAALTWESDTPLVATVENGTVTAHASGFARITVRTQNNLTAQCTVTVPVLPTGLDMPPSLALDIGQSHTLTVAFSPSDTVVRTLTWESSVPSVASVTDGVVTAHQAGTAEIIATAVGGAQTRCTVTVNPRVQSLSLPEHVYLVPGVQSVLTVTFTPADVTDKTLTWESSDPSVATVTDGTVTAHTLGTTVITATAQGGAQARCTVEVTAPATEIDIEENVILCPGQSYQFPVTFTPSSVQIQNVTWESSDPHIASFENGVLTAWLPGIVTVTATAFGGAQASGTVTVNDFPLGISAPETLFLLPGVTHRMEIRFLPENYPYQAFTLTSEDPTIVQTHGETLTALRPGKTRVIATAYGAAGVACEVTVGDYITDLEINRAITLNPGQRFLPTVHTTPEGGDARSLTWESSDEQVVSYENGALVAHMPGTATVTATAPGGVWAQCTVTVRPEPVEIRLPQAVSLYPEEAYVLLSDVLPHEADSILRWESSDETVFTVEDGVLLGHALGSATLTATAWNGVTAQCTVTVVRRPLPLEFSQTEYVVVAGETFLPGFTFNESLVQLDNLSWNSDDPSVTAFKYGRFVTYRAGQTTITLTDGQFTSVTTVTVLPCAYTVTDDGVTVRIADNAQATVHVPDTIDGRPVIAVEDAGFMGDIRIEEIYLPESVEKIGENAFYLCVFLRKVSLSEGLTEIGPFAFANCINLRELRIPASVTSIAANAFYQADNLTVSCYANSVAHRFCVDNGIAFVLVE